MDVFVGEVNGEDNSGNRSKEPSGGGEGEPQILPNFGFEGVTEKGGGLEVDFSSLPRGN